MRLLWLELVPCVVVSFHVSFSYSITSGFRKGLEDVKTYDTLTHRNHDTVSSGVQGSLDHPVLIGGYTNDWRRAR